MRKEWTGPIGNMWSFEGIDDDGGPCRSNIYTLIEQGKLEAIKVGRLTRITGRSYDAYKESLLRGVGASPFAA
jgi:excisionase family DNA binding protein